MTKYRAKPIVIDNIRFASLKEGRRYSELKLLMRAGIITELQLQPEFELSIPTKYRADFQYYQNGKLIVEDVKGYKTREYKRKKKAMAKQHNIEITET